MGTVKIESLSPELLYFGLAAAALLIVLYIIVVCLFVRLHGLNKRYNRVLAGSDGKKIEDMIISHTQQTQALLMENQVIKDDIGQIRAILQTAVQRVGVVRFAAFEDIGGDLSYAVALLDRNNSGIILSSIFARNNTTTYLKPIDKGTSKYKLSKEEQEALNQAMSE